MLGYKPIIQDRQPLAGLNLWPASTCLINRLAEVLEGFTPQELRRTLVVLPTRRLGTFLLARLAKRHGAFIPPRIQTLETLIAEKADAQTREKRELKELEESLILTGLLEEGNYKHLRAYHEHEILHLFSELIKEELSHGAFMRLEETLGRDIYKSEAHLNTLGERLWELKTLYQRYYETLETLEVQSAAQAQRTAVQNILEKWDAVQSFQYERIFMLGFTSVAKFYHPLLEKLVTLPGCQIWLSQSPELLSPENPLLDLCSKLGQATIHEESEILPQVSFSQSHENVLIETSEALSTARSLIQEKHIAPSQVAILVTNEGDYAQALRRLSEEMGFGDANIALEMPLADHPIGSWIAAFCDLMLAPIKIPALMSWLLEPATLAWSHKLSSLKLDLFSYRAFLVESLEQVDSAWSFEELAKYLHDSPVLSTVETVRDVGKNFDQILSKASTDEIAAQFNLFFRQFHFTRDNASLGEKSLASAAETSIKEFFQTIDQLAQTGFALLPKTTNFFSFLKSRLLQRRLRSVGEPLFGLQILSLQEARYFPFKAVLILGASEGNLPKALPKDELLDDYLKRAMGFSG